MNDVKQQKIRVYTQERFVMIDAAADSSLEQRDNALRDIGETSSRFDAAVLKKGLIEAELEALRKKEQRMEAEQSSASKAAEAVSAQLSEEQSRCDDLMELQCDLVRRNEALVNERTALSKRFVSFPLFDIVRKP